MAALRGDLRNPEAAVRSRWDWGWLRPAFEPSKISPSDIDWIVERNDRFLVLEIKPRGTTASSISTGQRLLLEALSRQDGFTVAVVIGDRNTPEAMILVPAWELVIEVTPESFTQWVAEWRRCAEGGLADITDSRTRTA